MSYFVEGRNYFRNIVSYHVRVEERVWGVKRLRKPESVGQTAESSEPPTLNNETKRHIKEAKKQREQRGKEVKRQKVQWAKRGGTSLT